MNGKANLELDKTILNFALIFRIDLKNFERIRDFLLKSGAQLIYQTKSTEKIFVSRIGSQTVKDDILTEGEA